MHLFLFFEWLETIDERGNPTEWQQPPENITSKPNSKPKPCHHTTKCAMPNNIPFKKGQGIFCFVFLWFPVQQTPTSPSISEPQTQQTPLSLEGSDGLEAFLGQRSQKEPRSNRQGQMDRAKRAKTWRRFQLAFIFLVSFSKTLVFS